MKKGFFIVICGIIMGGLVAYTIISHLVNRRAEKEISDFVAETDILKAITYNKVSVGLIQSNFAMADIELYLTGYKKPVRIDRVEVDIFESGQPIPRRAKANIEGFYISAQHDLFEPIQLDLDALGYDAVSGTIQLMYTYDENNHRFDINAISFDADQMGNLQMDLLLQELDLTRLVNSDGKLDLATAVIMLPTVKVGSGKMTYQDHSLIKRWFHSEIDPIKPQSSVLGRQSREALNTLLKDEKNARTRRFFGVVQDFIEKPTSITISANPPNPVPFLRFLWVKNMGDLIEILNIEVSI